MCNLSVQTLPIISPITQDLWIVQIISFLEIVKRVDLFFQHIHSNQILINLSIFDKIEWHIIRTDPLPKILLLPLSLRTHRRRGRSSGVVGIFLLWERWHGIMVTYTIITGGWGGGGGAWMNGHFSSVKIYVQTGGCNFLANGVVL